jgi:hypothetical protein
LETSSPQSDSVSSESDSEEGWCGYLKINACRCDLQNINDINNNSII